MGKRSLQASSEGIRKARQAFKRKGWTQELLAEKVGLETRQPIWKFFTGKPIERQVFNEICLLLDINPEEIVQSQEVQEQKIEQLTSSVSEEKVRLQLQDKIQHQCGTLRFLDVARPFNLEDVYVDVNLSEEISNQQWLKIETLQNLQPSEFDRLSLHKSKQSGLDIVAKCPRLMVQGRPGSGKSTFLQAIAIRCNQGKLLADSIPILINLSSFAQKYQIHNYSLFEYIYEYLNADIRESELLAMLHNGKALVLLDGLDEVPESLSKNVITQTNLFINKFYKSKVIITCRTAAQSYKFRDFTEVEIVDFNQSQIISFIYQWFLAVAQTSFATAKALAELFIQKLQLPENQQIRELTTTPLLLSIVCLIFYTHGDFPHSRSEVYKQGLELLLVGWDEARGIERDELYHNLSLLGKIKLLSHVAKVSFTEGQYFLKEIKIQQLISNYLHQFLQLTKNTEDTEALLLDSRAILKTIEAQHGLLVERARGIYSFSHLTFQEYLTARDIVANVNLESLDELVAYIHTSRWREVFLLVAEMLPSADNLLKLMKQKIDIIVNSNLKLKNLLDWVAQKTTKVSKHYNQTAVRAFYFTLGLPPQHPLARNQDIALYLDSKLAVNLPTFISIDMALTHALAVSLAITPDIFYQRLRTINFSLDLKHLLVNNEALNNSLDNLRSQLPNPDQDRQTLKLWWQLHGTVWIEKLRSVMINDFQIGYDWEFNLNEFKLIEQYWNACQLLLDCLNHASSTSSNHVRQSVKESLFLYQP